MAPTTAPTTAIKKLIFEKTGMQITKENESNFHITFDIKNENKAITNFISIDFIKLVHDLNPAIFERIQIEKSNTNEATIFLVYKDLFMDLGLPHYYSYFKVSQHENTFSFVPLAEIPLDENEGKLVALPMLTCEMVCTPFTPHHLHFEITAQILPPDHFSMMYVEKMASMIFYKVMNRVKQFIYNIE
jgi:hypothetical protein